LGASITPVLPCSRVYPACFAESDSVKPYKLAAFQRPVAFIFMRLFNEGKSLSRTTILLGPSVVIAVLLLYPSQSQKIRVEVAPMANPARVGRADVPQLIAEAAIPESVDVFVKIAPLPELKKPKPREFASRPKAVLGLIHYPWEQLGYSVVFLAPRPGFRAMTISDRHRIEVYMRSGDQPIDLAYDLAHELGHAFDLEHNDPERRTLWCKMRGIDPATPWFGCNRCPDYDTPAGDFAETFAFLLLGPGNYHSRMAPQPSREQVTQLAAFCRIDLNGLWCSAGETNSGPEPPISEAQKPR
jgi:hypothetical protein